MGIFTDIFGVRVPLPGPDGKVSCKNCGSRILQRTYKKNRGLCMPCFDGTIIVPKPSKKIITVSNNFPPKPSKEITLESERSNTVEKKENINDLKFLGRELYLEDIPGSEEIQYQNSSELRMASDFSDLKKLIEIYRKSPTSSDPAYLLAQCYHSSGRLFEALTVLTNAIERVKLKSYIAAGLGYHYLFFEPDFLQCLYWYLRSAIAQKQQPNYEGTYIYLYGLLSALNELWFGTYDKQARKCKSIADFIYGPGGIVLEYSVVQRLKQMWQKVPDIDISQDLNRALDYLNL
jgi:hypothetical protein